MVTIAQFCTNKKTINEDYVKIIAQNNVRNTLHNIRLKSPVLKEMEDKGQIKIIGASILTNGGLTFLDQL